MTPALVLAPHITTDEPKAPSRTPEPSATHDPGPEKTAIDEDPAPSPTPASDPQGLPQPGHSTNLFDPDSTNSNAPTPADKSPVIPDPGDQQHKNSADPPKTSPNNGDPRLSVHHDPAPQGKASLPTTIHLQPQSDEKPTTISLGKPSVGMETTPGIGALIFDAFHKVDPTAKSDGASDPKFSVADPVASVPTITVAGQVLTISDPSAVSIAGTILTPGGKEATVAGTPVSLASSGHLVVGTSSLHQSSTILTIAGHTVTANPTSFNLAGTAVKAGEPAVTVSGTSISMGVSGDLIIGSSASTTSPPAAVFTVGAQRFTADGANLMGSGSTITADGPAAVVAGSKVSLDSSGVLIVGDATTTLAELSSPSVFTVAGQSFTADGAGLVASGTTITAGGPAAVIAGTTVSLDGSGVLTVGDATTTLATLPRPSIFTVGGSTFTANPTGFSVAGATLAAGGPGIIINHTSVSLNPEGSLLIGTRTISLQTPTPPIVSTDGQVFTVEQGGLVAVDGVTLSSGGSGTTIGGIPMSVGSGGVVIGSDTVRLPTVNGSLASFTGEASESARISRWVLWGLFGAVVAF